MKFLFLFCCLLILSCKSKNTLSQTKGLDLQSDNFAETNSSSTDFSKNIKTQQTDTMFTWICEPICNLKSGTKLELDVPKKFQDMPLVFVILAHRQGIDTNEYSKYDDKPGLTSFQVRKSSSKDNWRYWRGLASGQGGAKFAERSNFFEEENLYEWYKYGHASVSDSTISYEPLTIDKIRLASVGVDSVEIKSIKVKFFPLISDNDVVEEFIFSKGTEFGNSLTAQGRKFGGGQEYKGLFPNALQIPFYPVSTSSQQLPKNWLSQNGSIKIPLKPNLKLKLLEIALGDSHPDGKINSDGGYGVKGWAKLTVSVESSFSETLTSLVTNENVPPEGVLLASPDTLNRVNQKGEYLVLEETGGDTIYVMAIRLYYTN